MDYVRPDARPIKTIYGVFSVSTSEVTKAVKGQSITIWVMTGAVWVNPNATAVADATALKITPDMGPVDMVVKGTNLSTISDATGGTAQVVVWEM